MNMVSIKKINALIYSIISRMIVTILFVSLHDAAGCCRKSKTVTPESSSEQVCFRVSQSNKLDADPEEFGQND
jgi:hypothetical protein